MDVAIVRKGAPFKEALSNSCNGTIKVKSGTVKCSFMDQPLTAYYVPLVAQAEFEGITKIIY